MAHFCYTYASSLIIATNTFYHAGSKDHSGLKESSCEQHRIFISVGILSENMHEPLKWVTEVSVIKHCLEKCGVELRELIKYGVAILLEPGESKRHGMGLPMIRRRHHCQNCELKQGM